MTAVLTREAARRELAKRELERRRAKADPLFLMSMMSAVDQRTGTRFSFEHLRDPLEPGEVELQGNMLVGRDKGWRWQRYVAERVLSERRLILLKGRQIGVTWVVLAADVAEALTMPGTASLLYRQREDEAIDNVHRWWVLYQSLPAHFREGIRVLKPDRSAQPGRDGVALQFPDGAISEIVPMTSAVSSGHGRSTRRILLDEAAYIELLEGIRAAVEPAAGPAAIDVVSTANGRSNIETGEGNEFHRLWATAGTGYERLFLPYSVHPDRDEDWYASAPEVQSLKVHQRNAQFPRDEHEAFALTSRTFFDADDLRAYKELVERPLYRFDFVDAGGDVERDALGNPLVHQQKSTGAKAARLKRSAEGMISVFREPDPAHTYAIGADVASGRGADYSAAVVLDLSSMEIVAQFRGKLDADLYAAQLHFLGRWYGAASGCRSNAWLAVEAAGGWGEPVIIALRDGRSGRPAYGRLYRHVMSSRPTLDMAKVFGFPMNQKTRPLVLNNFEESVRERALPWVTDELLWEMESFVRHDKGRPEVRALEGSNDDLVMACAIALEMFRLYGKHPERDAKRKRRRKRERKTAFPWQEPTAA